MTAAWLDQAIYLYPSEDDARNGNQVGGSGFLVSVPFSAEDGTDFVHTYAVTNDHVIQNGQSPVIRVNLIGGGCDVIPLTVDQWESHPDGDDISVTPLFLSDEKFKRLAIPRKIFLTKDKIEERWIGHGDEVFFVGRYINHEGRDENHPTVRFGSIAQIGGDKVEQRQRGNFMQESVLVEIHSLPGFSGSPVFVFRSSVIAPYQGADQGEPEAPMFVEVPQFGQPLYLLGVDWGHHPWRAPVLDANGSVISGEYVEGNSGLAMVVPAWKLDELLDHPDLVMKRRIFEQVAMAQIRENRKKPEQAVLDSLATEVHHFAGESDEGATEG